MTARRTTRSTASCAGPATIACGSIDRRTVGHAVARNVGIRLARGDLVSMLDSDDLWLPRYLETMVGALRDRPDSGFAYTDAWILDQGSRRIARRTAMARQRPPERDLPPDRFLLELMRRNFIFNSVTVRRSALERVGGYSETLKLAEDYELWLRLSANGHQAVRIEGPLAVYRFRDGSLSRDELGLLRGLHDAYRLSIESHPGTAAAKSLAGTRLAEVQLAIDSVDAHRSPFRRISQAARSVAHRLLAPSRLRLTPPPELSEAFPWLLQSGR